MTATLPPPSSLRTYDETRTRQPLPGPSSPAWTNPATVWRIALFRQRHVDPAAHKLGHPNPIHDCPFCPPAVGEAPVRSSEQYVRELAERRPLWSGRAGAAA